MPANKQPGQVSGNSAATTGPEEALRQQRQQQLERWLLDQIGIHGPGVPASSDASFRRYYRYHHQGRSMVAMDAPPASEDCRPFVKVAGLLTQAGVTVPDILAQDLQQGFLLLSDLGPDTYLKQMNAEGFSDDRADAMFALAITAMIKFQRSSQPGVLPAYDQALLRRELDLFPYWYLQQHLKLEITSELSGILESLFQQLISQVTGQACVYVHRDYMPRNLMVMDNDVGVLDFQDAVYGPVSYDPICLFKDAFISWPGHRIDGWLQQYWQQALSAGVPVPKKFEDFQRDCDFMGVQRHLKVIGIFARICHRDGKPQYLEDVPRFFGYLHTVAQRRPELRVLQQLLALIDAVK